MKELALAAAVASFLYLAFKIAWEQREDSQAREIVLRKHRRLAEAYLSTFSRK